MKKYPTRNDLQSWWQTINGDWWGWGRFDIAEDYYIPAPITMKPTKQAKNMHKLKIRKQPPAKAGYRRGQRREA